MTDNTFTTLGEAIASITDAIEAGGAVTDARTEYDLDAIADELITEHADETPEGATIASSLHFAIDADEDTFWATVEAHELTGPITAELTNLDTPAVIDGRKTTTDTITITRDGIELDAIDVESSEDEATYNAAVRSIIGTDQPFTWIR
ncbi:hypothetical protein [Propionibacterium freudenreichii]|uniref:hypothetical protein n=1 Tax=Propionibacterium freudenreichii TaxID=1744 RepID=UPI0021A408EC|nr:hypothetical protein [Propionibacterium freudenreichii]MCT2978271.1 hypothetical protein [Propionibacterium freudenreichii]MCT3003681.1 hypothetical protein [Propionibacterium freudenreichii]MCT3018304.1 hypothetical protein [Propionibacterium freudenreichii]